MLTHDFSLDHLCVSFYAPQFHGSQPLISVRVLLSNVPIFIHNFISVTFFADLAIVRGPLSFVQALSLCLQPQQYCSFHPTRSPAFSCLFLFSFPFRCSNDVGVRLSYFLWHWPLLCFSCFHAHTQGASLFTCRPWSQHDEPLRAPTS